MKDRSLQVTCKSGRALCMGQHNFVSWNMLMFSEKTDAPPKRNGFVFPVLKQLNGDLISNLNWTPVHHF